jgi:hypothetical protein
MTRHYDEPVSRPRFFDYFFLLGGVSLSLYLMLLSPIGAEATAELPDARLGQVVAFLPTMMRLPEGVFLLWPLFFATQWVSRSRPLTAGEWLWLLAWVGLVVLTALTAWEYLVGLPDSVRAHAGKPRLLWYVVVMPAMGVLAVLFLLFGVFRSTPAPWTDTLALALVIWPVPLALTVLSVGNFTLP